MKKIVMPLLLVYSCQGFLIAQDPTPMTTEPAQLISEKQTISKKTRKQIIEQLIQKLQAEQARLSTTDTPDNTSEPIAQIAANSEEIGNISDSNDVEPDDDFLSDIEPVKSPKQNQTKLSMASVLAVCRIYCSDWYTKFVEMVKGTNKHSTKIETVNNSEIK